MEPIILYLAYMQIVMQMMCAYLSFMVWRMERDCTIWLMFAVAFLLMTARRVTALLLQSGHDHILLVLADKVFLPALITFFLFFAVVSAYNRVKTGGESLN